MNETPKSCRSNAEAQLLRGQPTSIHDVDIVQVSTKHDAPSQALFGSMHAGSGHIHGVRIENVTV